MCGINGFILRKKDEKSEVYVHEMNEAIIHRGPDGEGIYTHDSRIALGMRRLAVIDLSSGMQPMYNDDKTKVIIFNGEIYNYIELKKDFSKKGTVFTTNSDTEVILKGYELYGKEIVNQLNGMFVFAIYDLTNKSIFIARDKVGEKPLYYFPDDNLFAFSSELKSIKRMMDLMEKKMPVISKKALQLYFTLTFIPAPHSIYEGIYKLPPASFLEINTENNLYSITKYWDVKKQNKFEYIGFNNAKKYLHDLLYDSVERRMISDVPIGIFLSGGVDSSIITSIMADLRPHEKVKTFSIISNNPLYDESVRSNAVAKHWKTEHHPLILDFKDLQEHLDEVILNYDEPFGDSSALATFWVSKLTRQHVTVALTGDGGDEVFGGYNRYLMNYYSNRYRKLVPNILHELLIKPVINNICQQRDERSKFAQYEKLINSLGKSELEDLTNIMSLGFLKNDRLKLLKSKYNEDLTSIFFEDNYNSIADWSTLSKARYMDKNISLEGDMLVKVDRASMLNSLECRPPLLDSRLFEFSNSLPDKFLINGSNKKRILKETFEHLVPKGLFNLPKKGFSIPIGTWLKENLKDELIRLSNKELLVQQGIFEIEYIQTLIQEHLNHKKDHTYKLWTFYCFQKWYNNI